MIAQNHSRALITFQRPSTSFGNISSGFATRDSGTQPRFDRQDE
jgi:hypothetical protein